ncbi:bifunctional [glutamate--ammonia ligase]-adenylyl-L-tyrosine phosphorylase/[glutamate--ammonia-ligase] adenylyltransferase [Marinagarivorans cellulosilyticus]|uniref:Bifunctional glutamine synthetase adenylyltransferase/adenylyl-removing enzyme n=1 Tax=Marinagarivorans cellulosilyticus TaxID=2721545 RepID=A0AAN2BMC2_9GAMM|nr:bifunctional [glutamate--ammonia ligase]-adenylyl-L-tyrosine phosphorylase/[glutamate--ammonia-ligase] adenylyltransferase [Marinagarivorans cellulosilyticus]BCD99917.1 [glutamine synthetase] adenylyltransferase / [glutamine synthetase]-adenylyl-L-tyrosine phosphorylase [Marinagarivorans cellulosilyticus]
MADSQTSLVQLQSLLAIAPEAPDSDHTNEAIQQWLEQLSATSLSALFDSQPNQWRNQWHQTLACSLFVRSQLLQPEQDSPTLLSILPNLNTQWAITDYQQSLQQHLAPLLDDKSVDSGLRQWRNLMMVRCIWRDLNRLAPTLDITKELTLMADVAVNFALNYHYNAMVKSKGTPVNAQGQAQPMLVIGMGKLGAYELNLSSDIDLIFAYPESGQTTPSPTNGNVISNQEFFTQLGQKLIKTLDAQTADGFVFRVDMRLRPYGQSGALVSNFDALENYYLTQGRDWERYAMVKARVMACSAGDAQNSVPLAAATNELLTLLRNFTYRKYVDFSAIEALRDLKTRIRQEVKRRRLKGNVKLGEGGIREVEFIVQALQLIRGGRDSQLQTPSLVNALNALVTLEAIPADVARALLNSYLFLRNAEHAIQAWQDKQTQDLPQSSNSQWALAQAMGAKDWPEFELQLSQHMHFVSEQFGEVIADKDNNKNTQAGQQWRSIWNETQAPFITELLEQLDFDCADDGAQTLLALHQAPQVLATDKTGADRLNRFVPLLLQKLSSRAGAGQTLQRLQPFIIAIARRSAYLLLLIENPAALEQLVILSEASPWIPERLAEYPALLDELLSPTNLYQIPNKEELSAELTQTILRIPEDDLEQQMEALRYFRHAHGLKVAACEVTGKLPLMKVSDYLTELAEVVLSYALDLAWQDMCRKHGLPGDHEGGNQPNFVVIGYGKLGGIELGHGSDLDLVFIHNANAQKETQASEGQRALDNHTFYTRMGQKLILLLDTKMPSGTLYEVDMRLRPSGNSGMLVSTLSAFSKYQSDAAWTWEHQALVRTRVVAGNAQLAQEFAAVRKTTLCSERDLAKLKKDVTEMRQKMRSQLGSKTKEEQAGQFHIKQDAGGIVDIEFIVQYLVLAHAHNNPTLVEWSDNIRILEAIGQSDLLSETQITTLIEAYKALRSETHKLALQQRGNKIDGAGFEGLRGDVQGVWRELLE